MEKQKTGCSSLKYTTTSKIEICFLYIVNAALSTVQILSHKVSLQNVERKRFSNKLHALFLLKLCNKCRFLLEMPIIVIDDCKNIIHRGCLRLITLR